MRARLGIGAALLAVLLAGCGGSSNASHTTTAAQGGGGGNTTTTVTSTVTTTTPPTTSTATTSPAPSGQSACTAADLQPVVLGQNGAAGHAALGFALRNDGSSPCHTYGFPGVQLLSASGAPAGPSARRTTNDLMGHADKVPITLSPGQEASFRIITSDVSSSGGACPAASSVQIIAPDDTQPMRVTITGIQSCGAPTVSPLEPGRTAFANGG